MLRKVIMMIRRRFGLAERRACRVIGAARSTARYEARPGDDSAVIEKMKEIIKEHPCYGCRMIFLKLRQVMGINHKRVERIYRENCLQLKNRRTRKKYRVRKEEEHILSRRPGEWVAIDFVNDSVGGRRRMKLLTAVDPVTREVPVIAPAYSMTGKGVADQLDKVVAGYGHFTYLQTDNGPEFRSSDLEDWCRKNSVKHIFSRPGKPTDNCFIESFNRVLRSECLNMYYFPGMSDARALIEEWRVDYNTRRPQKGLGGLTPLQYKDKLIAET